jgi:catechol 2,3-dioxygenase-like lactoylglutathione lyase family enzyme
MMKSPHVSKVDHTGITVSSLEDALHFWVEVLGFEILMRDTFAPGEFITQVTGISGAAVELAMVRGGDHTIELLQYSVPEGQQTYKPRPCDIGSMHVCLLTDDIDSMLKRVAAAGWNAVGVTQTVDAGPKKGMRVMYVRGPDGTMVEFWQPPN